MPKERSPTSRLGKCGTIREPRFWGHRFNELHAMNWLIWIVKERGPALAGGPWARVLIGLKLLQLVSGTQAFFLKLFALVCRSLGGTVEPTPAWALKRQEKGLCRESKSASKRRIRQKAMRQSKRWKPSAPMDGWLRRHGETSSVKLRGSDRRESRRCERHCRCRERPVRRAD